MMYDTEDPVPRNDGRPKRRYEAFKNISIGTGALGAGAGVAYGGYKAGKAAEDWQKSSPAFIGRSIKAKGKGILQSAMLKVHKAMHLKAMMHLQSRIKALEFATLDYTRKLLAGTTPVLARPGEPGYDPRVERQVKAAFKRKHPLSPEEQARRARQRAEPIVTEAELTPEAAARTGTTATPGVVGTHPGVKEGKKIRKPGQQVKPYRGIKGDITRQQKDLTALPKEIPQEELPLPENLPRQKGGKIPKRGSGIPGTTTPPYTWDPSKGGPGEIHHTYPGQLPRHLRPLPTAEEIRANALNWRDVKAYGEARVARGIKSGSEQVERESAQTLRDKLAAKVWDLRRQTVLPMRAARRKALGLPSVRPMSEGAMQRLRSSAAKLPDIELPGKGKRYPQEFPHNRPSFNIGGLTVSPQGLQHIHQEQNNIVAAHQEVHKAKANNIRHGVIDRIHKKLGREEELDKVGLFGDARRHTVTRYDELRKSAEAFANNTFDPERTDVTGELARVPKGLHKAVPQEQVANWEISQLAGQAGVDTGWMKKQHDLFVHHTHMGETQVGADKIRKSLGTKIFAGIAMPPPASEPAKRAYPLIKRLGKRTAIGAGIAAGVGLGAYGVHKWRNRNKELSSRLKEIRFAKPVKIPYSQAKSLLVRAKKKLITRAGRKGAIGTIAFPHSEDLVAAKLDELGKHIKLYKSKLALMTGLHENLVRDADVITSGRYRVGKKHLDLARAAGYLEGSKEMEGVLESQRQASEHTIGGLKKNLSRTKRIAVGAGVAGLGVGAGAGYAARRNGQRKETQFAIPKRSALKNVQGKLLRWGKSGKPELIAAGALTGSVTDAATSAVFPEPDQTRRQSALRGAKRGLVYGSVLSGVEPLIRVPFLRKHTMASRLKEIRFKTVDNPLYPKGVKKSIQRVPIKRIVSHQNHVERNVVEKYKKKPGKKLPTVFKVGSKYYVEDGNHRIVSRMEKGEKTVRASVRELQVNPMKEIRFQKWATLHFDEPNDSINANIPSPWNKRKRLTVMQDRYRKQIREREIQRKESNIAKSAVAGAALGGLLHHKAGLKLGPSLAIGAAGGLGAQAAALVHGRQTRDPYGEESIASKRIERLPYQVGGLAAAGLVGRGIYKAAKAKTLGGMGGGALIARGAKRLLFNAKGRLIRFQFLPSEDKHKPWHEKEVKRWIEHPQGRVEETKKWLGRAGRIHQDYNLPKDEKGRVIDERGRTRQAEWQKPWFKRTVYGGAAVGGLVGLGMLGRRIGKASFGAAKLMAEHDVKPEELRAGQRMALNITSGNVFRAAGKSIGSKFPSIGKGVQKVGGLHQEARDVFNSMMEKGNKWTEGKVGHITGAVAKRSRKSGEIYGYDLINPAKAEENLGKIAASEAKAQEHIAKMQGLRKKVQKTQETGSVLDELTKMSILMDNLINFKEEEPGYVKVKPHYRKERRGKFEEETEGYKQAKQRTNTGAWIGGTIAATGLAGAGGIAWKSGSQRRAEKLEQQTEQQWKQIKALRAAVKRAKMPKIPKVKAGQVAENVGKNIVQIAGHSLAR